MTESTADPTLDSAILPFETDRLRLRPVSHHDLDGLLEVYSHPRVTPWLGDWQFNRASLGEEIERRTAEQTEHGFSIWAVEELASSRLVGDCGLQLLENQGPEVEVGYELHPDAWGSGFASEAGLASLELAFAHLDLDRVVAVVRPDNGASIRVLEKLGMTHIGERHAYGVEMLYFEIRSVDWSRFEGNPWRSEAPSEGF